MKNIFIYADEKSAINYVNAIKSTKIKCCVTCSLDITKCINHTHLILCGGGDVHPAFYSMPNKCCKNISIFRDLAEFYLINYFYSNNLPILGICRGMQIINVAFGGSLTQSLRDINHHQQNNCDVFHPVECNVGFLNEIYGRQLIVNSAHHQAINSLGDNLISRAYTDDFICEALEHKYSKIFGVQFHPERMGALGIPLYKYFLELS